MEEAAKLLLSDDSSSDSDSDIKFLEEVAERALTLCFM
jgi:hypothetical protein